MTLLIKRFFIFWAVMLAPCTVHGQDFPTYDQCGGEINTEKGIIKSPNYPKTPEETSRYPSNQHCLWKVSLGDPNTLFMGKFWDLVTEHQKLQNNQSTCFDYVNVTTESKGTEQYCGFAPPEDVFRGVGPTLSVLFVSDEDREYRGFMFTFQAKPDHDPCREDPCKEGECVIMEDRVMFECNCNPGYTGYICNIDIDECASEPCENGGKCEQNKEPGYTCFCTEGWQGDNCEIVRKPDPCLSNPCRNGGTCAASDDNEEFKCTCSPGYSGITCRTNIDECASDPCENDGFCEDGVNGYECTCEMPYYGDHCENKQKINGCRDAPCSENGDCVSTDDEGGYRCECLPGWTGKLCDEDLKECSSSPCKNGGICDDSLKFNHFQCTCVKGYTGRYCQTDIEHSFTEETPLNYSEKTNPITESSMNSTGQPTEQSSSTIAQATTPFWVLSEVQDIYDAEGSAAFSEAPPMCKNPGIPYVTDETEWEEGATLRFYCIEGYVLNGPENLTCLKNESWSRTMPQCVADGNSTAAAQGMSPFVGTMVVLSTMLAVTLVAFVSWILLKGPWNFGPNVTRIMSFSRTSLSSYDPHKYC